jgi:uncharacterized protein YaaW (UPF0174 family)
MIQINRKRLKLGVLNYLNDSDLVFLSKCQNDELDVLVKILTEDEGVLRDSEDLTLQTDYKKNNPNHRAYWHLIAAELQYYGGNTIANGIRGHGVLYDEILGDVCDKMDIKSKSENDLLNLVYEKALSNMSPDELNEIVTSLNLPSNNMAGQASILIIQAAIRAGGFASYQLAVIMTNAMAKAFLGHGLSFATNALTTRIIGVLAGPIGLAISGLWTVFSLAGPAFRVTVPAVIYISLLRKIKSTIFCKGCNHILTPSAKFCPECGKAVDQPIAVRT